MTTYLDFITSHREDLIREAARDRAALDAEDRLRYLPGDVLWVVMMVGRFSRWVKPAIQRLFAPQPKRPNTPLPRTRHYGRS